MTVNISAAFKKDTREYNGLSVIAEELLEEPHTRRVVVALVETKFSKKNFDDGGVEVPTVAVVHIEPLDGDAADTAKALLVAAYRERTGRGAPQDTLPFAEGGDNAGDEGPVAERDPDVWLDDAVAEQKAED